MRRAWNNAASYRDFGREVLKVNEAGRGHAQTAPLIDGFCSDNDTSNNFPMKLRTILSSGNSMDDHLSTLKGSLSGDLESTLVSPEV